MMNPMRDPVTHKSADHSAMDGFSFSFFCDMCGMEWQSARLHFNPGDFPAPMEPNTFQLLWNDQHEAAFERANRDASFAFNRCPVCGRRVCKECFYLAETGVSDICKDCLRRGDGGIPDG